jgi:hypothetical protein
MKIALVTVTVAVALLAGCGDAEPTDARPSISLDLLGKPCSADTECDPATGIVCSQLTVPTNRACEYPVSAATAAAGDCPDGTAIWGAALFNADGTYSRLAYYCAQLCRHDSDCGYGRQCFSRCGL